MPLTAYGQQKAGDLILGNADWTMPSTHVGLFTASPGENGSLVSEFSGGSYARVALTAKMGAADATTGIAVNTSAVTFAANTAAHGLAAYAGILDGATLGAGNVIWYAPFGNPRVINNGDPAVAIAIGDLSVRIVGAEAIMLSSYAMKKLVDHGLGKASYSKPTLYHGLLSSNPTIAGTLSSEVGVGAYVRQLLTGNMTTVGASDGASSNALEVRYPTPTADYPTVNYSFAADAVSGGNMIFANQLAGAIAIRAAAAPALFRAGDIRFVIA